MGAFSLASALRDADARAASDAQRAAIAVAMDLRRVIGSDAALSLAAEDEGFTLADDDVVVPAEIGALEPRAENPRLDLSGPVAASLDELDRDPAAARRLEQVLDQLQDDARGTVLLALAWQAWRSEDRARAGELTATLQALVVRADTHTHRGTAAGLAFLLATQDRHVPGPALDLVAQGTEAEAGAVADRLRELGAGVDAEQLEERRDRVGRVRRNLLRARSVLGVLVASGAPLVLGIDGLILLYRPTARGVGQGAVIEPAQLVERILAADNLTVVPFAGEVTVPARDPAAIEVVPGALAIAPATPSSERSGPLGLLLVFAACAATFLGALFAVRRGMLRERDAMRARSEFLTSVTHELRTPIAAIRLLAERLSGGLVRDEARRRDYHAMLASEATRLGTLVENVLDLGRMDRGERSYDRRRVIVGEVIADTARVFGTIARAEGIDFEVEDRSDGVSILVDRGALQQALLNLCDNARKYGRGDGPIELSTTASDRAVTICVRDHGPGVDPADRERIFERFVRGESQRSGAVPGVGLGLHLSRAIAVAQGGTLVHRVPDDGQGAEFVLDFPRAPDDEATT